MMILYFDRFSELDVGKLMSVYSQSNLNNAEAFWPKETRELGVLFAENDFRDYLRNDFFRKAGAFYAVLALKGEYCSALRMEPYRDGWLLEALETRPDLRGAGMATALMRDVLQHFVDQRVYSHVEKRNTASLSVHEKCGFRRLYGYAVYLDGSVTQGSYTLCYDNSAGE